MVKCSKLQPESNNHCNWQGHITLGKSKQSRSKRQCR